MSEKSSARRKVGRLCAKFSVLTPLPMILVLGMSPLSLPMTFVFLALPVLGFVAAVIAFSRIGVEGARGLRLPALIGLGINLLIVATFVLNWSWWLSRH